MKVEKIVCPNCKRPLGDVYVISGKSFLFDGEWLIRTGTHNCPVCTARFFWHGEHYDKQYVGDTGGTAI